MPNYLGAPEPIPNIQSDLDQLVEAWCANYLAYLEGKCSQRVHTQENIVLADMAKQLEIDVEYLNALKSLRRHPRGLVAAIREKYADKWGRETSAYREARQKD